MNFDADLREIRSLHARGLQEWFDTHPDAAASRQWWWGIMETIEAGASFAREMSRKERCGLLNFGARLLAVGLARSQVAASAVAYWQIRLAVGAARSQLDNSELAKYLTLSGAVRWALDHMPGSREEIVRYSRNHEIRYRSADESLYARPPSFADLKPDPHVLVLQETEMVFTALRWIDISRLDEALRADAESWLDVSTTDLCVKWLKAYCFYRCRRMRSDAIQDEHVTAAVQQASASWCWLRVGVPSAP